MKKFNQLTVLDSIYFIEKKKLYLNEVDHYGNVRTNTIVRSFEIENITLLKSKNHIGLNEYSGYSGQTSYRLRIPLSHFNKSRYFDEDDSIMYFADKKQYNDIIRKMVVNKINDFENEMISSKKSIERNIQNMRKKYYEYLS